MGAALAVEPITFCIGGPREKSLSDSGPSQLSDENTLFGMPADLTTLHRQAAKLRVTIPRRRSALCEDDNSQQVKVLQHYERVLWSIEERIAALSPSSETARPLAE